MNKPFGGKYKCSKGHESEYWFFDSQPRETLCVKFVPRKNDICRATAKLVSVINTVRNPLGKKILKKAS